MERVANGAVTAGWAAQHAPRTGQVRLAIDTTGQQEPGSGGGHGGCIGGAPGLHTRGTLCGAPGVQPGTAASLRPAWHCSNTSGTCQGRQSRILSTARATCARGKRGGGSAAAAAGQMGGAGLALPIPLLSSPSPLGRFPSRPLHPRHTHTHLLLAVFGQLDALPLHPPLLKTAGRIRRAREARARADGRRGGGGRDKPWALGRTPWRPTLRSASQPNSKQAAH